MPGNIYVPVGTLAEVVLAEFEIESDKEINLLAGGTNDFRITT